MSIENKFNLEYLYNDLYKHLGYDEMVLPEGQDDIMKSMFMAGAGAVINIMVFDLDGIDDDQAVDIIEKIRLELEVFFKEKV